MQSSSAIRPRLDAITSLRFFAALHVLLVHLHANRMLVGPRWFQALASVGYLGVGFFFVLSGFILVYTYAGREFSAREFWQARFARVYPAYAASLIFALPLFSWVLIHLNFPFLVWVKDHLSLTCLMVATLTQSWVPQIASAWNPVAWSLAVEAFFYLVFPVLCASVRTCSRRTLIVWLAAAWVASLSISGAYGLLSPDGIAHTSSANENLVWLNVVRFNPLVCLPQFMVGMAAGLLFLRSKAAAQIGTWFAIAGAGGFSMAVVFREQIPYPMLHSGLLAPAFAAIIFGVALRPRWTRLLESRALVLLGESSYSLYLLHFTVIWAALVMFGTMAATITGNLAVLTVSLLISVASYKFIEVPARKRLRELSLRNLSTAAPARDPA